MYMHLRRIIQVTIEECEQRNAQVWDTEKEPRDRKQKKLISGFNCLEREPRDIKQKKLLNGFHTVWDAKFEEKGEIKGRVVLNKNLAFLKFVLTEARLFL